MRAAERFNSVHRDREMIITMPERQYDPAVYWEGLHRAGAGKLTAVGHAALGPGYNRVAYRLRIGAVRRCLRRVSGGFRGSGVFEAAVGVGAYGPLWRELGLSRWVGVDLSSSAVAELGRRSVHGEFAVADITSAGLASSLGLPRRSFGLVTAIDVLYHIVDDAQFEAALRNLTDLLSANGVLVVTDIFVRENVRTASHVHRRSMQTYERVLRAMGLKLVMRESVTAFLTDPVPRSGVVLDRCLHVGWRLFSKMLRILPEWLRSPAGSVMTPLLIPADALFRRSGMTRGFNLEVAVFRRDA